MERAASKQLRVFEEELKIIFDKASKDKTTVQLALSSIIKEWREYDKDHQSPSQR